MVDLDLHKPRQRRCLDVKRAVVIVKMRNMDWSHEHNRFSDQSPQIDLL